MTTRSILANDLTCDAFLGGRLNIWQPAKGYRAGVDPVFLASAVNARSGQHVLELGCGVGVAALALARRCAVRVTGVELQAPYAELARRNARENELEFAVVQGDLANFPQELREKSFDHVMANPPYFDRRRGTSSRDEGREIAMGESTGLGDWVDVGVRRLKPKGYLTLIQSADRLGDLLSVFDNRLGDICVLPLAPRDGRDAERVIVRARKGANGAMRILAPFVLHKGRHHQDGPNQYTNSANAVLREGHALAADW